tara:strand:+ start:4578 stop:5309 length:732 start_codon:yes stop_codon:yes gene_type:complete
MDQDRVHEEQVAELERRFQAYQAKYQRISNNNSLVTFDGGFFDLRESIAQWSYEHPKAYRFSFFSFTFLSTGLLVFLLWIFSSTSLGYAIGFGGVKDRVTNAYYAALWAVKVGDKANLEPMTPETSLGYIEKVIGDLMVVSYFENGTQYRRLIKAANVVVEDIPGFVAWGESYKLKPLRFDFYLRIGQAAGRDVWATVLWKGREPINVQLVERHIGYPEVSPPTAVVNQLYSRYYWDKAKSGE